MDDDKHLPRTLAFVGTSVFLVLLAIEVVTESEPIDPLDLAGDALQLALVVLVSVVMVVALDALTTRLKRHEAERTGLLHDLSLARAEGDAWRRQAQAQVEGLGAAIERQMLAWGLSAAEREVGVLMLKGFVHKEIAALRGTSEATVRHQARAIYAKAGVEGRAGFCAWFLEDLLADTAAPNQTLPSAHPAAIPHP